MKLSSFLPCALALNVAGQAVAPLTEPKTGISFQAFSDSSATYTFGIALPTTPSTDFIGIIIGKGKGWSGVSLGGSMVNKLLLVAWPSGTTVVSSFRKTAKTSMPPEVTGAFSMVPIAAGTYVNTTHYTYTFLCKGCILTDGTTFAKDAKTDSLGYAFSTSAPATPAKSSSSLSKHSSQGRYAGGFAAAKSDKYATWAALANGTLAAVAYTA